MDKTTRLDDWDICWATLQGKFFWPAIVIPADEIQRPAPKEGCVWVFWFGDGRISEVKINRTCKFKETFKEYCKKDISRKWGYGIIDAIKELAYSIGISNSFEWSDDECKRWMREEQENVTALKKLGPSENLQRKLAELREIRRKTLADADSDQDESSGLSDKQKSIKKQIKNRTRGLCHVCMGCFSDRLRDIKDHPVFEGHLCTSCLNTFKEKIYEIGADRVHYYCTICSRSGEVFVCDAPVCGRVYCIDCVETFCAARASIKIKKSTPWHCFLCTEYSIEINGLVRKRPNWQDNIHELLLPTNALKIPKAPMVRRPIRVVSLFDGIGTARLILNKLNIKVEVYYSFEIDKDAMNVTRSHFKDVIFKGDVRKFNRDTMEEVGQIDLLVGGSPCEDLSCVNPKRKGIYDPFGTGILFFEFYRILKMLQEKNENLLWLFENVVHMEQQTKFIISRFLESQPILYNSEWFSAQMRARYFWGNIPGMRNVKKLKSEEGPKLQELLNPAKKALVDKTNTLTTNPNSLKGLVETEEGVSSLEVTEMEKLFGFDLHYTDANDIPVSKRKKLLGRSWCVQSVTRILSPLTEYFTCSKC